MPKTKRIFISDIHLSSEALYKNTIYPSWYQPGKHNSRLIGFLDNNVLGNPDGIKDVILLGDIFNTWMCPAKLKPPTYEDIFDSNQGVINKFKELMAKGINLFYLNGNHDCDLEAAKIKNVIPGIQVIKYYRTGRIHAEHGNEYDLFNKLDYRTDPAFGMPIGYFISRLIASTRGSGYGIIELPRYVDDILEAAISSQNLYTSIIEGLAERAGLGDNDELEMPTGRSLRIIEIKERYNRLDQIYSKFELLNNLYDRRYLNGSADRLCKNFDFNVVVFGHTHKAMLDKDFFLVEDRIYANTGSWCKENAYFVEVDKNPDPSLPTYVYLHKVKKNGEIEDTKEEKI